MEFFCDLEQQASTRRLPFLVIGGFAVNFYGYSRDTADLDLLICRKSVAAWRELFSQFGYSVDRDAEAFIQLAPPSDGEWPVDLMLVGEPTFAPMWADGREVTILGARLKIT